MHDRTEVKHTFHFRVIMPSGVYTKHAVEMSKNPTLKELKAMIEPHLGGAHMEHVLILLRGGPADMFVDELFIPKGLQRNETATEMYRHNWLTKHPNDNPESLPYIAGIAVVFEELVWT